MVMAALTALKSTKGDLGMVILLLVCGERTTIPEVELSLVSR
jgi:hypothetical protein